MHGQKMPSASAADGLGKIKNNLKVLIRSYLIFFALMLIANVQAQNYSEEKLQCFLSLVSKGLGKNNQGYLITNESRKMLKGSEYNKKFTLSNKINSTRITDGGWLTDFESVWNMTKCESDQLTAHTKSNKHPLPQKKDDRTAALAGLPTRIDLRESNAKTDCWKGNWATQCSEQ